ncbi:MAG TPA: hypothetical protein VES38_03715 [Methylotenera sp.]|nr:hypothetical protein [Methylotenera sp.]
MNLIARHNLSIGVFVLLGVVLPLQAHESAQTSNAPLSTAPLQIQSLQVKGQLPVLDNGIADIKFSELFKTPVGARGMEPTEKLISLNNKRVRIVGYMAKQETPTPGLFIVSPLPVNMGDEDDKFADDMPANSIFVHLDNPNVLVGYVPGLINLIGVLSVGNAHEVDDRISYVRVKLDPELSGLVMAKP